MELYTVNWTEREQSTQHEETEMDAFYEWLDSEGTFWLMRQYNLTKERDGLMLYALYENLVEEAEEIEEERLTKAYDYGYSAGYSDGWQDAERDYDVIDVEE
jgi:hypothetical protein